MDPRATAAAIGYQVYQGPRGGRLPKRGAAITGIHVIQVDGDLALIEIDRTTVYAGGCKWKPSTSSTRFIVGHNENGQPFSHCVSKRAGDTVALALQWIWGGKADRIVARQGDVAVVTGRGRNHQLPASHVLLADGPEGEIRIVHLKDQHAPVTVPPGCHIIVGRRADDSKVQETHD